MLRRRGPSGYVGLVNLGATCYANSVFQQLFMQPAIRQLILGGPEDTPGAAGNPSVFGQLQAWPCSAPRELSSTTATCVSIPRGAFPHLDSEAAAVIDRMGSMRAQVT